VVKVFRKTIIAKPPVSAIELTTTTPEHEAYHMKLVLMLFAIALPAIVVSAQTPKTTEAAGLKIIRVELQHSVVKGPSLRAVPSTDPSSQAAAKADRSSTSDNNPALHRLSENAEIAPKTSTSDPLGANTPAPNAVIFFASVLVKNIGTKPVTAVHWEYLLFEKDATEPIKRYRVQTKKLIPPGEQAELTKEVTPKGYEQQARITRIEYADGTFWQQK
jgi:hypothetical protein